MIDFSGLFMTSPKYKISAHPHQSRISLIEELGIIKEMRDLVGKAENMKKKTLMMTSICLLRLFCLVFNSNLLVGVLGQGQFDWAGIAEYKTKSTEYKRRRGLDDRREGVQENYRKDLGKKRSDACRGIAKLNRLPPLVRK
jgi:hypothetical protein